MRARINHGKRGTGIDRLVKRYEFECPREFYGYILDSYANGLKEQVIELFNEMKGDIQKAFLMNVERMDTMYGGKVHDLIIQNL